MEKRSGANHRDHGAERAHGRQRRLFMGGEHRFQPPSGQNIQGEEDQTAEQAQHDRRFIAPCHHGGSRDTGGEHGHGCFH